MRQSLVRVLLPWGKLGGLVRDRRDAATPAAGRSRKLASLALLPVAAATVEALAWGTGVFLQGRGVFYRPQPVVGYERYLAERHPVLGWPPPSSFGKGDRDESGSRIIPAFAETRDACVSLYGDSFTWGGEVDAEHAWSNLLSQRLGCRVSNFGEGGYGSDQAYLRFLHDEADHAPQVVLGHLSENILRNVNQLRGLLYPGTRYGLKPRFVLDEEGRLQLVPLPRLSRNEFRRLVARPEDMLSPDHEYFLPGGPAGVQRLEFPFLLSVLRAFRHFHVRSELAGRPWYAEFYEPDHDSGALALTVAILAAFERAARERGRTPTVLIIPTGLDLTYYVEHHVWPYQALLERLRQQGIEFLDAGPGILRWHEGRDPCSLFHSCSAHFNEAGNAALAHVVFEYLQDRSR